MPSKKRLSAKFSYFQFRLSGAGSALIQVSFRKSEKLVDLRDRFCYTWNSKRKISNDSMKERTTRDRFLINFFDNRRVQFLFQIAILIYILNIKSQRRL